MEEISEEGIGNGCMETENVKHSKEKALNGKVEMPVEEDIDEQKDISTVDGPSVTCKIPYFTIENFKSGSAKQFDEIIDVRTPLEFAEDRIIGSINLPVLSNEQRVTVGTLYAKDRMAARKLGAGLISGNISQHILNHFIDKPGNYKPLIYCWRGGQRSRSMALILNQIGFDAHIFQGGYKEYRKVVRDHVQENVKKNEIDGFHFILMSGTTGNGKSRILEALKDKGEQMLHLEELAKHKGSVLGNYPGEPQPNQKYFESEIYQALQFNFVPEKVVWVEYESFKIGNITVPKKVSNKMMESNRIHIEVDLEDRIKFILKDYDYICNDKPHLMQCFSRLERLAGKKKCDEWRKLVDEDKFEPLVRDLIVEYYDKCYRIPRGEALDVFKVPEGIILDKNKLLNSQMVLDIINLGDQFMKNPTKLKIIET